MVAFYYWLLKIHAVWLTIILERKADGKKCKKEGAEQGLMEAKVKGVKIWVVVIQLYYTHR